jgi:hypothetical protein
MPRRHGSSLPPVLAGYYRINWGITITKITLLGTGVNRVPAFYVLIPCDLIKYRSPRGQTIPLHQYPASLPANQLGRSSTAGSRIWLVSLAPNLRPGSNIRLSILAHPGASSRPSVTHIRPRQTVGGPTPDPYKDRRNKQEPVHSFHNAVPPLERLPLAIRNAPVDHRASPLLGSPQPHLSAPLPSPARCALRAFFAQRGNPDFTEPLKNPPEKIFNFRIFRFCALRKMALAARSARLMRSPPIAIGGVCDLARSARASLSPGPDSAP